MNIENVLAQFRQSGAWLKAFHAGCELESVKVESLEVLSVLEKNLEESYPNWRSSRFMIKVMAFLEAHRSDIDGQNLGWGYIHDDFHPNNLIFCGEVLVGIDFNGSQKNFALSDLVTYLNHLAHLSMLPKGIKIRHHLSAFEAAFLAGYGMDKRQDSQLSLQWLRIVRALRFFASFRCNSQNPLKNAYFQTVSRYNINTLLTNFSHIKDSLAK